MKSRTCPLCKRPLPQRRWWQLTWLILPPPPTCRLEDDDCIRVFTERVRAGQWTAEQHRE